VPLQQALQPAVATFANTICPLLGSASCRAPWRSGLRRHQTSVHHHRPSLRHRRRRAQPRPINGDFAEITPGEDYVSSGINVTYTLVRADSLSTTVTPGAFPLSIRTTWTTMKAFASSRAATPRLSPRTRRWSAPATPSAATAPIPDLLTLTLTVTLIPTLTLTLPLALALTRHPISVMSSFAIAATVHYDDGTCKDFSSDARLNVSLAAASAECASVQGLAQVEGASVGG